MTEFEIKNYDGQIFLKKELRDIIHTNPVKGIANFKTVVLFSQGTPLSQVKKSLKVTIRDIELREDSSGEHGGVPQ